MPNWHIIISMTYNHIVCTLISDIPILIFASSYHYVIWNCKITIFSYHYCIFPITNYKVISRVVWILVRLVFIRHHRRNRNIISHNNRSIMPNWHIIISMTYNHIVCTLISDIPILIFASSYHYVIWNCKITIFSYHYCIFPITNYKVISRVVWILVRLVFIRHHRRNRNIISHNNRSIMPNWHIIISMTYNHIVCTLISDIPILIFASSYHYVIWNCKITIFSYHYCIFPITNYKVISRVVWILVRLVFIRHHRKNRYIISHNNSVILSDFNFIDSIVSRSVVVVIVFFVLEVYWYWSLGDIICYI